MSNKFLDEQGFLIQNSFKRQTASSDKVSKIENIKMQTSLF